MEEYIRINHFAFNPVAFLEFTCADSSCEYATSQFEEIIDKLCLEEQPTTLKKWCQRVKDSNYEVSSLT